MIIKFILVADQNRLQVKLPQADLTLDMPNVHIYDRIDNLPLGFGLTEKQRAEPIPEDLITRAAFTPFFTREFSPDLALEQDFLQYHTALAHEKVRGKLLSLITFLMLDCYDYELWLEDFEQWSEDRKLELEYMIQVHCRGQKVVVNGNRIDIPAWKRQIEGWTRNLAIGFFPLSLLYIIPLLLGKLKLMPDPSSYGFYIFLAGCLGLVFMAIFAGKVLWMISMRRLVPKSYLRYRLPEQSFRSITLKLANRFLAQ
jgi:hypothetical protein